MHHPASLRNREVILPELQRIFKNQLSQNLNFLSVAEGTGAHMEFFHPHFPNWVFYPTEYQAEQVETSWFQFTDGSFHLSFILKIQTARVSSHWTLQTPD